MLNCMDDLLILRRFGLWGRPSKAPVIKSVVWSPPASGWIKVNTDSAAMGSPGVGGCGGIFQNCRAFVKGCFVILIDQRSPCARVITCTVGPEAFWSSIRWDGNQVAYTLSKHALELHADSWWLSALSFCSSLVGNDCIALESFRFS
ncbi:hypothetical protein Dsin_021878 [Dipteronia sinensis]|uniref:RNase H type-1 domain-containing protein n=1 Tax=Dipteronia sinensis TaxID=43782 RepID=A0AAE0A0D4_9ROSI|nr:hypothetical protein Dsin_021878 [Dipteronia sinensis]